VHVNNLNPCSDGNACTVGDTCGGGFCVGGAAPNCNDGNPCTDDSCDPASGCNHLDNNAPCNDGLSCTTGDTCKNGACAGNPSPPDCTEPKGTDFYRQLCALGHAEEELSPATLACVAGWSTFRSVVSVSDVCGVLNPNPSGDTCKQAEAQLMAAVLNVCKGRLALDEPIRSSCTDHTTVGSSLLDANQLLANPSRTSDDCSRAQCETKELNSGTAAGMGTLTANRTAQGVRLDWSAPPFRAGWPAPSGYTVWRRPRGTATFSAIAVATDPMYNDASVPAGIDYEYQVTTVRP
jgi:hypothetical protein